MGRVVRDEARKGTDHIVAHRLGKEVELSLSEDGPFKQRNNPTSLLFFFLTRSLWML